jgi:hypothetical protein
LRAHAFAAGAVALAVAALRVLGCSSSGCDMTGTCCCGGDAVGVAICGVNGPTCVQGLVLYRGEDCNTKCRAAADAQPESAAETAVDAPVEVAADADAAVCNTSDVCCCAGDVLDYPMCTDGGQTSCRAGYGLYRGDDCRCLPDRNTPCCLPHVLADAATGG